MKIRYVEGDPRAGRVVQLDEGLAKRFIADGVAEEVDKETPLSDGADMATGDGSTGTHARPDMSPNATAEETSAPTGIRGQDFDADGDGVADSTDPDAPAGDGEKATGATANKAVTSRTTKTAAKKSGRR
jgi:hypothetical protein